MIWRAIKLLLTLKCEESTRLVSRALDESLPSVERWAVRLHAVSCRSCRHFRQQVELIQREVAEHCGGHASLLTSKQTTLSTDAKARIESAIADDASNNSS